CDAFLLWAVFCIVFAISFLPIGTMIKKAIVSKQSFKIVLKIETTSNSNPKTSILFSPPLNLCPILLYPLSQLTKLGKSSSKYYTIVRNINLVLHCFFHKYIFLFV